jgi:hypothetical protein
MMVLFRESITNRLGNWIRARVDKNRLTFEEIVCFPSTWSLFGVAKDLEQSQQEQKAENTNRTTKSPPGSSVVINYE